jgi:hypothetical protein
MGYTEESKNSSVNQEVVLPVQEVRQRGSAEANTRRRHAEAGTQRLEKPESEKLEGLGAVRSSRVRRLARTRKGVFNRPGRAA